jgi:hypothetical protein
MKYRRAIEVSAVTEVRARAAAVKARETTCRATTSITVDSQQPRYLRAIYPEMGADSPFSLLKRAPVLADARSSFVGLLLTGQDLVVVSRDRTDAQGRTDAPARMIFGGTLHRLHNLWGAPETFLGMSRADWLFVEGLMGSSLRTLDQDSAVADHPVPAIITSRVRTLAYYPELVCCCPDPLPVLQRWAQSIQAVEDGASLIESMYGKVLNPGAGLPDLTVEQILATRDKGKMRAWADQALRVVRESRDLMAAATERWTVWLEEVPPYRGPADDSC